jgi:hypothetical protein
MTTPSPERGTSESEGLAKWAREKAQELSMAYLFDGGRDRADLAEAALILAMKKGLTSGREAVNSLYVKVDSEPESNGYESAINESLDAIDSRIKELGGEGL